MFILAELVRAPIWRGCRIRMPPQQQVNFMAPVDGIFYYSGQEMGNIAKHR